MASTRGGTDPQCGRPGASALEVQASMPHCDVSIPIGGRLDLRNIFADAGPNGKVSSSIGSRNWGSLSYGHVYKSPPFPCPSHGSPGGLRPPVEAELHAWEH
eukprot:4771584-Pyramimonas_sp.AAC.1